MYAWESVHTLHVKVCATQTPFHLMATLHLNGDTLQMQWGSNVAFGERQKAPLRGRAVQP